MDIPRARVRVHRTSEEQELVRTYTRVLKVVRTIADLANSPDVKTEHVAETIQYGTLDRDLWVSRKHAMISFDHAGGRGERGYVVSRH